jgi:hypothetical protein
MRAEDLRRNEPERHVRMPWLPVTTCSYIANKLAVMMSFISLRRAGATWRSGYATVCKTVYTGSIPVVASIFAESAAAQA